MNKISTRMHGYLDFVTVVIFLLAPTVFGLTSTPAAIAYLLAVVHLVMTLATDFPFGVVRVIPFSIHGWVERVVGPTLVLLPLLLGFFGQPAARNFYIGIGIIIIVVGFLTDYSAQDPGAPQRVSASRS
jgi:hypothetical protein